MAKLDEPVGDNASRGKTFYRGAPAGAPPHPAEPRLVTPGRFSDGQHREGTNASQIHRAKGVAYDHPSAHKYLSLIHI